MRSGRATKGIFQIYWLSYLFNGMFSSVPDSGQNVRDHFIRQRRNLILASLIIVFYQAGELSMPKLNIFGNEVIIGNQNIIITSLAIFLFYFFIRYCNAIKDENGLRKVCSDWITSVEENCDRLLKKEIKKWRAKGNQKSYYRNQQLTKIIYHFNHYIIEGDFYDEVLITVRWRLMIARVFSTLTFTFTKGAPLEYALPYALAFLALAELIGCECTKDFFEMIQTDFA